MTERKKLSLNKPEQAESDSSSTGSGIDSPRRKPPVRGPGTAPRKRMTASEAAEAAKAREEAAERERNNPQRGNEQRERGAYGQQGPRGGDPRRGERDPQRDNRGPARGQGRDERPQGGYGAQGPRGDQGDRGGRPAQGDRDRRPSGDSLRGPYQGRSDAQQRGGPGGQRGHDRPRDEQRGSYSAQGNDPRHAPRGDQRQDPRSGPYRDAPRDDRRPAYANERSQSQQQRPAPYRDDRRDDRRADGREGSRPPRDAMAMPTAQAEPRENDGRIRLSKLMSEKGLASRREADEWIEHGWVRVDGEIVSELGSRVLPDQVITIDPAARTQQAQRVTILINKPIGYVSGQAEDGYEPAVVLIRPENRWIDDKLPIELTRGHLRNLAPAGRLDIDSTGLLVLTQDGRIAKHLIGEDSGVEKEYLVRVEYMPQPEAENVSAIVPPEDIELLRFGLELDGRQLKPAQVSWQNEQQLRFVLREGRKRQIRRMCEQVGLKVVGLKRVRMGSITLGKLPIGQWRFLRPDERF